MSSWFTDAINRVHHRVDAVETAIKADSAAVHQKLDAALLALHHILSSGAVAMDHDALLALANQINGDADKALAAAEALANSHDVKTAALDDIGAVLNEVGPKLGQIAALAPASNAGAQADTGSASQAAVAS